MKAKTKTQKRQIKAAGFKAVNGRAVVHVGKKGSVRRRADGGITISTPDRRRDIMFSSAKGFDKLIARARKKKLANNQVWGFQVGDNPTAHTHFKDFGTLVHYLDAKDDWHIDMDDEDAVRELQREVALVLITETGRSHYVEKLSQERTD